jgi:hypothetical protein
MVVGPSPIVMSPCGREHGIIDGDGALLLRRLRRARARRAEHDGACRHGEARSGRGDSPLAIADGPNGG